MKKWLRTWLAGVRSGFPTAFSPYWHMLPLRRLKTFLAGYFFIRRCRRFRGSIYYSSMLPA